MWCGSSFVAFYGKKNVFSSVADKLAIVEMLFCQSERALEAVVAR